VTYVDRDGAEHTIQADSVVICGGSKPRMDEALSFAESADRFFVVGDCSGTCGNLQTCNRDAWSKANML
jgi:pyruvate/2-oxoglutarate dehydrogenase complex dihydrolipoamide dehydrogenase (E3) component